MPRASARAPQPAREKGRPAGTRTTPNKSRLTSDKDRDSIPATAAPATPTVVIRHEVFGIGFDVTVEPKPEGPSFDKECATVPQARGYARGLRLHKGWPIRDETGEVIS